MAPLLAAFQGFATSAFGAAPAPGTGWSTEPTAADMAKARTFYKGHRMDWAAAIPQLEAKVAELTALYHDAWTQRLEAHAARDAILRRPGGSYDGGVQGRKLLATANRWDSDAQDLAVELHQARTFLALAHEKAAAKPKRKPRKRRNAWGEDSGLWE